MRDLWFLLLTAICFIGLLAYVKGCQALGQRAATDGDRP
jgi:hypothetical protein